MSQGSEGKIAQGSTFGLPTEGHEELVSRLSQVENLLEDVLGCTKGAAAAAASSAVDTAVHRARTKSKMLPVMGSGHVLAALNEVESEVTSLPGVSVANAALMREMTEGMGPLQGPSTPQAQPEDRSLSVRTQRGEPPNESSVDASEEGRIETMGSVESAGSPSERGYQAEGHPSSVLSVIAPGGSTVGQGPAAEDLESTAGSREVVTARDIIMPLVELAAEVCTASDPECTAIRRTLRLKKPRSGDLKMAKEVDFDQCVSPRAHPLGTPRFRGACLEFGLGPSGKPRKVEPVDTGVDQFSPMSPELERYRSEFAGGGTGQVLMLKGEPAPGERHHDFSPSALKAARMGHFGSSSPPHSPGSPRRRRQWHSSLSSASGSGGGSSHVMGAGGEGICEAGAPPGLMPTARVEGYRPGKYMGDWGVSGGDGSPGRHGPIEEMPREFGPEMQGGEEGGMSAEMGDLCSEMADRLWM